MDVKKILNYLHNNPNSSVNQITDSISENKHNVIYYLKKLMEENHVKRERVKKAYLYSVVEVSDNEKMEMVEVEQEDNAQTDFISLEDALLRSADIKKELAELIPKTKKLMERVELLTAESRQIDKYIVNNSHNIFNNIKTKEKIVIKKVPIVRNKPAIPNTKNPIFKMINHDPKDRRYTIGIIDLPNIINSYVYESEGLDANEILSKIMFPVNYSRFNNKLLKVLLLRYIFNFPYVKTVLVMTTPHYKSINNYLVELQREFPQLRICVKEEAEGVLNNGNTKWKDVDNLVIDYLFKISKFPKPHKIARVILLGADWRYTEGLESIARLRIPIYTIFHEGCFPNDYNRLKIFNKREDLDYGERYWTYRYFRNSDLNTELKVIESG